jgi:hypothetical protein
VTGEASFRYLIGIDPDPDLTASEVAAFDQFYDTIHQPEVVAANRGFLGGHRLEAMRQPSGDGQGPRWLAFYEISDLDSVRDYLSRQRVPGAGVNYTPGPVPWTAMTTTWRAMLTVAAGPDVTRGRGPVLLTASAPGPASAGPTTVFEVLEDLGGASEVPATLTAWAGPVPEVDLAELAGLRPRPTWSRYYRRTGAQP